MLVALDKNWWLVYKPSFGGVKLASQSFFEGVYCATDKGSFYDRARNSGRSAILLADDLGASDVYLLGYDCKVGTNGKTHWHGSHTATGLTDADGVQTWAQSMERFASMISANVINCTRDTALTCFEQRDLESVL